MLVVDNASTDDTGDVIASYDVHYISEPKIGLSHARNTAVRSTETEFIVFLDDDAIPDPEWCAAIHAGIKRHHPDVFGGPYRPYYIEPKPPWFIDEFGSAHLTLAEGEVEPTECFSGGNMGWRTELLREMGGFNPALGMTGSSLGLGEETALQIELRNRPATRRVFLPKMSMTHYVAPGKMSLRYIATRSFQYGRQLKDIDPSSLLLKESSLLSLAMHTRFGTPLLLRCFIRNRRLNPCWQTFAARFLTLHMIEAGVVWEKIRAGRSGIS